MSLKSYRYKQVRSYEEGLAGTSESRFLLVLGILADRGFEPPYKVSQLRKVYKRNFLPRNTPKNVVERLFKRDLLSSINKGNLITLGEDRRSITFIDSAPKKPSSPPEGFIALSTPIFKDYLKKELMRPTSTMDRHKKDKSKDYIKSVTSSLNRIRQKNPLNSSESLITVFLDNAPCSNYFKPRRPRLVGMHATSVKETPEARIRSRKDIAIYMPAYIEMEIAPIGGRYSKRTFIRLYSPSKDNRGVESYESLSKIRTTGSTPDEALTSLKKLALPEFHSYIDEVGSIYKAIIPGPHRPREDKLRPYLSPEEVYLHFNTGCRQATDLYNNY
jgi:hypothetical protein